MEEQKKGVLERFTLEKVKVKGQGLEAHWESEKHNGAEIYLDKQNLKSDKVPHEDLRAIINVFRSYMSQIYFFSVYSELADSPVFMADEKQIKLLHNKQQELEQRITITGISLSGKEDNKGLIITATLKVGTGHVVAINSQRLKFNGSFYGFEEDLQNLVTDLEQEVFEYVINGKAAQLEIAFSEEKTENPQSNDGQLDLMEEALNAEQIDEEQEEEQEESEEEED